jgi:phage virion morphogenesis protein
MTDEFSLSVDCDDREAQSFLGNLTTRLQGLDPLMNTIAGRVEDSIQESFDTQAAPDGSAWAALAPSTLKQKQRLGQSSRILVASGRGKASIRVVVSGNTITCSFEQHMGNHQRGTRLMPKRKFAPEPTDITPTTALGQQIEKDIENYLNPNLFQFMRGEVARTVRLFKGR